jgi:hypothetical protein
MGGVDVRRKPPKQPKGDNRLDGNRRGELEG